MSVVNCGISLAGEGDSVTGAVTLRSASDFVKSAGAVFCFLHSSHHINVASKQYSDHGQSVISSLEYCNGKNVSTNQL